MLQRIKIWFLNSSLFIAVILSIAIAIMSLTHSANLPLQNFKISDKLLHAFAYFGLIWSWLLVFRNNKTSKSKLILFIALIAFGIILELLQGSLMQQYRSADWRDVLANVSGLCLGLVTFKYMYLILFKKIEQ